MNLIQNKMSGQVLDEYLRRYPQLTLPIADGMSASDAYRDIVRKGKPPGEYPNPFHGTDEDGIFYIDTPAGKAEVLYLADRRDFRRFLQSIVYRCEPAEIPASTGAMHISGITNWQKIHTHKEEYLKAGNFDWSREFRRFTAEPANFKDTLLVVSKGEYSALPHTEAGFSQAEWIETSLTIRIYHELTHFVCRKLYPERKDVIWDEIAADCMGIYKALGYYDTLLAQKLLGVEGDSYKPGGRLENYVEEDMPTEQCCRDVKAQIMELKEILGVRESADIWGTLSKLYQRTKKKNMSERME